MVAYIVLFALLMGLFFWVFNSEKLSENLKGEKDKKEDDVLLNETEEPESTEESESTVSEKKASSKKKSTKKSKKSNTKKKRNSRRDL